MALINIYLSPFDFDYDVQALVRSFYPREQIAFVKMKENAGEAEEKEENQKKITVLEAMDVQTTMDAHASMDIYVSMDIRVQMEDSLIRAELFKQGERVGEIQQKTSGKAWDKESSYRPVYKNLLKKALFKLLAEYGPEVESFPKQIPAWGTMTGVRPTKIPLQMLESGMDEAQIITHLTEDYCCSREKAGFSFHIARKEKELLAKVDYQDGYSLYIGIPFCPTTCLYCSFTSYPIELNHHLVEDYLEALKREIRFFGEKMKGKKLTSIYFGGGTPTSLSWQQLDELLSVVKESFNINEALEYTVEAGRPDSITMDKLKVLKNHGVSRISVNPQTMKEETLACIGRKHTVKQTIEAFHMAREAGFDNINMDLIMGLPDETLEDFQETMKQIKALDPDSITLHSLVVKRASQLRSRRDGGEFRGQADVNGMLQWGCDYIAAQGYEPYYMYRQKNKAGHAGAATQDNAGFARKGKECLYNILIMEEKQTILALGAGASTKLYHRDKDRVERIETVKSVQDFIKRTDEMIGRICDKL